MGWTATGGEKWTPEKSSFSGGLFIPLNNLKREKCPDGGSAKKGKKGLDILGKYRIFLEHKMKMNEGARELPRFVF